MLQLTFLFFLRISSVEASFTNFSCNGESVKREQPSVTIQALNINKNTVSRAMSMWNNVRSSNFKFKLGASEETIRVGRVDSDSYTLGRTHVWFRPSTCRIFKSEIIIAPKAKGSLVVIAHELGHAFGASHSGDDCAVMAPNVNPDDSCSLHQDDIRQISSLYPNANRPPGGSTDGGGCCGFDESTESSFEGCFINTTAF